MILVIVSMVDTLSMVSLILWAIGITLTFTALNKNGAGINLMRHTTRRILLGVGMTLTLCSLFDQISTKSFILFTLGFFLMVTLLEKSPTKN